MPTQSTTYNTRLTDENLERRFRETFKSQSGAELVDDLYASGVIVPVVDFTAAAEGSDLRSDLQLALDTASDETRVRSSAAGTTVNLITGTGFFLVNYSLSLKLSSTVDQSVAIEINTGSTTPKVHRIYATTGVNNEVQWLNHSFIVFLRTQDTLQAVVNANWQSEVNFITRQVADLYGNLTDPSGFQPQ